MITSAPWKTVPMGELCSIESGASDTKDAVPDGPYAFFDRSKTIKRSTRYLYDCEALIIPGEGAEFLPKQFSGKFDLHQRAYALFNFRTELSIRFLFHYLHHRADYFPSVAVGATVKSLRRRHFVQLPVPVPPLPEQRRIIAILDEAFAAIATAKANTEKSIQNAREVFESDLASIFTTRGPNWRMRKLAEVSVAFGRGKSRHRPRNEPSLYGGKYPFVQTGDVRNAVDVIETYTQTYSEKGLAQSKLWPKGTVCITIAANIAESAILGFDSCFPDSIIGAVPDTNETSSEFLLFLIQSFKAHLQAQGKGSAQHNINMGTFEDQSFPFPPLDEQAAIVKRLLRLREESSTLSDIAHRKLAALDALKASLLHHAFTGHLANARTERAVATA